MTTHDIFALLYDLVPWIDFIFLIEEPVWIECGYWPGMHHGGFVDHCYTLIV